MENIFENNFNHNILICGIRPNNPPLEQNPPNNDTMANNPNSTENGKPKQPADNSLQIELEALNAHHLLVIHDMNLLTDFSMPQEYVYDGKTVNFEIGQGIDKIEETDFVPEVEMSDEVLKALEAAHNFFDQQDVSLATTKIAFMDEYEMPIYPDEEGFMGTKWFELDSLFESAVSGLLKVASIGSIKKDGTEVYIIPLHDGADLESRANQRAYMKNLMFWEGMIKGAAEGPLTRRTVSLAKRNKGKNAPQKRKDGLYITGTVEKNGETHYQTEAQFTVDAENPQEAYIKVMQSLSKTLEASLESLKKQMEEVQLKRDAIDKMAEMAAKTGSTLEITFEDNTSTKEDDK